MIKVLAEANKVAHQKTEPNVLKQYRHLERVTHPKKQQRLTWCPPHIQSKQKVSSSDTHLVLPEAHNSATESINYQRLRKGKALRVKGYKQTPESLIWKTRFQISLRWLFKFSELNIVLGRQSINSLESMHAESYLHHF